MIPVIPVVKEMIPAAKRAEFQQMIPAVEDRREMIPVVEEMIPAVDD